MTYGCIGEKLSHSFSVSIHEKIGDYPYELREIARENLGEFLTRGAFSGINVTIPYKEAVIPCLDRVEGEAREIGAVNTIVNRGGKRIGYNTDFSGMRDLFGHARIDPRGKVCVILGTGGTSKTARALLSSLGAGEILSVTHSGKPGAISYEELGEIAWRAEVLVNTTPVGMFPDDEACPVDLSRFPKLSGVIDAVYHPLRTRLVSDALARGIPAEGGLFMLVSQAVRSAEIFFDIKYPEGKAEEIFRKMLSERENIVLIGMPGAGMTAVGRLLAQAKNRVFLDTGAMIEEKTGLSVPAILARDGEAKFREAEDAAIREAAKTTGTVIAAGGGSILSAENIAALRRNGKIVFSDCPEKPVLPPLAKARELYLAAADVVVPTAKTPEETAERIPDL